MLLITFGIFLATYASSQSLNKQKLASNIKTNETELDFFKWLIGNFRNINSFILINMINFLGIAMLIFALLVSALMGIYQEKLYSTYGKHPEEALFYSVTKNDLFFSIYFVFFLP